MLKLSTSFRLFLSMDHRWVWRFVSPTFLEKLQSCSWFVAVCGSQIFGSWSYQNLGSWKLIVLSDPVFVCLFVYWGLRTRWLLRPLCAHIGSCGSWILVIARGTCPIRIMLYSTTTQVASLEMNQFNSRLKCFTRKWFHSTRDSGGFLRYWFESTNAQAGNYSILINSWINVDSYPRRASVDVGHVTLRYKTIRQVRLYNSLR